MIREDEVTRVLNSEGVGRFTPDPPVAQENFADSSMRASCGADADRPSEGTEMHARFNYSAVRY